ncbi:hypothetical protein ACIQJT_40685 [Streptomyces sp. NPDC091972]|uniref:hypothetical protein n=1 Tax=Streptomyces sp. NPDC091972 TaxID=3366007 RepID=UPI003813AD17
MSESTSTVELTSQYTAQVGADLERNSQEQAQINEQIESLRKQLEVLQRDEVVLVNIQQAISAATDTTKVTPSSQTQTVPPARKEAAKKEAGGPPSGGSARVGRNTPKFRGAVDKKASAGGAGKTKATQKASTLIGLVRDHLSKQSTPLSATEIAATLDEAYPQRSIKVPVVRVTLESLVAKNEIQRIKQGRSVFYARAEAAVQLASESADESAPVSA